MNQEAPLPFLAALMVGAWTLHCNTPASSPHVCNVTSQSTDQTFCANQDYNFLRGRQLPNCPYNYQRPANLWSVSGADVFAECSDAEYRFDGYERNDCNAAVTDDRDLRVVLTHHNKHEANITVSWDHLHLNITPGSIVELKLYDSNCASCPKAFSFCIRRYICISDTAQTSITIQGAKYKQMNEIQLAVISNSTVRTLMKTRFANVAEDFVCTNILPYVPERCPPEKYGPVRNLTAEAVYNSSVGTTVSLISWLPPAEAERFHVQLVYYLNISRSNAEETSLFSIEASADGGSDKSPVSVYLGPLNTSHVYSVGVMAFVYCSGCGQRETVEMVYSSASTYIPSTTVYSPTSEGSTSIPTNIPPSSIAATSDGLVPNASSKPEENTAFAGVIAVSLTIPLLLLVVMLLVLAASVLVCHLVGKKKHHYSTDTERGATALSTVLHTPTVSAPEPFSLDQPPPVRITNDQLSPTVLPSPSVSERTIKITDEEETKFRALIVYSAQTPVEVVEEFILPKLASGLKEDGITPVCHALRSQRGYQPFVWLREEVPKVSAVLCVCTEEFLNDWTKTRDHHDDRERDFTLAQTLRHIILTRQARDEGFSEFASILLGPEDARFIPDLLQLNKKFNIEQLDLIGGFVKGIPQYVLAH